MKLPRALPDGLGRPSAALLPQAVTVVAAVAIASQLVFLLWRFAPGARRPPPPLRPVATAPGANVGAIAALFPGPAAVPGAGAEAPQTRVALVLSGTLAVRDPKAGLAIIAESAQAAQSAHVYVTGDSLPGGVRLHEVYADRVVLDRGGQLETLPLPRPSLAGGATAQLSPSGNGPEPGLADNVQRLVAQGPEVVGEVLRPMPMYANGLLKGFRVYAGRDRRKFAKLGLQPGDLVTQINGVPLADATHGLEVLRTLGNAATANVTVERGGQTQQITVDASQVAAMTESPAGGPPAGAPPGVAPGDAGAAVEAPPKPE
ncbi:MAG: PDZ domain-containing protein [Proteobacteria bacterium]|nr:PDZ domain-containing protein [Pseudomonadota bacterium]